MIKRNPHIAKLQASYLFPEIQSRVNTFLQRHPEATMINLGIGDTTRPITPYITEQLMKAARDLGTPEGYSGYGPEQGHPELRHKIAERFYAGLVDPEEIFISDGAKCDVGRLQHLFGRDTTIAVQDPTYPVYVDTSVISGKSPNIHYMPCTPNNNFFSDPQQIPKADIIYFCSPNNPTGSVATKEQLRALVNTAKSQGSLIIFDSAYSCFIQDPHLPRSIFEVDGARAVAIEMGSFSKMAGFTGLRLAWCIIPKTLSFDGSIPLHQDWMRITTTFFNGASNIAQRGGIAALEDEGFEEIQAILSDYLTNANRIKNAFLQLGFPTYGGTHSPYVWVNFSPKNSWDIFDEFLHTSHIITVPGSGFGPAGEGFLRFSAFGHQRDIETAIQRIAKTI